MTRSDQRQNGVRILVLKPCAIRRFGVDWEISMGRLICTGFPLASGTLISDYLLRKQPEFKVYWIAVLVVQNRREPIVPPEMYYCRSQYSQYKTGGRRSSLQKCTNLNQYKSGGIRTCTTTSTQQTSQYECYWYSTAVPIQIPSQPQTCGLHRVQTLTSVFCILYPVFCVT